MSLRPGGQVAKPCAAHNQGCHLTVKIPDRCLRLNLGTDRSQTGQNGLHYHYNDVLQVSDIHVTLALNEVFVAALTDLPVVQPTLMNKSGTFLFYSLTTWRNTVQDHSPRRQDRGFGLRDRDVSDRGLRSGIPSCQTAV